MEISAMDIFQNRDVLNPFQHGVGIKPPGHSASRLSPGLQSPLPTQNSRASRFALDQVAWMLCFVSPALVGSSFTYAEHPGTPIPVVWYSSLSSKYQVDTSEQQGGGTCQSEVKKEAEGRMTRTAACATARLRSHPLRCLRPTHEMKRIQTCQ